MKNDSVLEILKILLLSDKPLSTNELVDRVGCDRKTVYSAIDRFEDAGFVTEKISGGHKPNKYCCKLKWEDIKDEHMA